MTTKVGSAQTACHPPHDDSLARAPRFVSSLVPAPQTIMQPRQLPDVGWGESQEKAPQRGLGWESRQARHLQKGAVVLQDLSLVDAAQSQDDREQEGKEHFLRSVVADPLFHRNIALQFAAKLESLAELLHEPRAAEMSQMALIA